MSQSTNTAAVRKLAIMFIERSESLGLKGKRRDDAALEYFCGAYAIATVQEDAPLAEHLGRTMTMMVSVRGYFAVRELAAGHPGMGH